MHEIYYPCYCSLPWVTSICNKKITPNGLSILTIISVLIYTCCISIYEYGQLSKGCRLGRCSTCIDMAMGTSKKLRKVWKLLASQQITAKAMESWVKASCRTITSPSIVSHHYQLCTVVYTSSLHVSMYV